MTFLFWFRKNCKPEFLKSSVELLISQEEDLEVLVDPFWMESALSNLLLNSVQHSPEKGHIWMNAKWNQNKELVFSIKDEGPGIAQENLGKIFNRFQSFRQQPLSSVEKGTGIGPLYCSSYYSGTWRKNLCPFSFR